MNDDRPWCTASGSEDDYVPYEYLDGVKCNECGRMLNLTKALRLPRHLNWTGRRAAPVELREDAALRSHVTIVHRRSRIWIDSKADVELRSWHESTGCTK